MVEAELDKHFHNQAST